MKTEPNISVKFAPVGRGTPQKRGAPYLSRQVAFANRRAHY